MEVRQNQSVAIEEQYLSPQEIFHSEFIFFTLKDVKVKLVKRTAEFSFCRVHLPACSFFSCFISGIFIIRK